MLQKIQKSSDLPVDRKKHPYYNSARSAPADFPGHSRVNRQVDWLTAIWQFIPNFPESLRWVGSKNILPEELDAELLVK